jgi:SAM-dependent methyltransferase
MNRRDRRAAQSQGSAASARAGGPGADELMTMFTRALEHQRAGEAGAAVRLYRKILDLKPDHAAAGDRLAAAYASQGKLDKASEAYAELARIAPQTLSQFGKVLDTLKVLLPGLAAELANGTAPDIRAQDVKTTAANPYFQIVLQRSTVCDAALERWLTALRASILAAVSSSALSADGDTIAFCSALAQQCFINEYVFAISPDEAAQVEQLKTKAVSQQVEPAALLALAMYMPLHQVAGADAIASRSWPAPVAAIVTQQIVEPREEAALRDTIPHLTPIADGVTAQVRQQYEENPYPRWAALASPPWPLLSLDDHLRRLFPTAPFRPVGHEDDLDILVVGCGTGRHVLELAQSYRGAHVLAIDLSLSSLAHVKRRTPSRLSGKVELAQADIMALGSLDRRFDLINAGGVFHHMPDPWAGWREIIKLMKPDGVMQVGLYSAHARRDIVAARKIIADRGYRASPDDIRRLRHDLAASGDNFSFMRLDDYFTVSTCRDLLFHVHEVQTTIPEIKAFLAANGLRFVGFDFGALEGQEHYRNLFARNGWSLSDLDRWDVFERDNPQLFAGMYVFWVQKA